MNKTPKTETNESIKKHKILSEELQGWLESTAPKTVGGLIDAFDERSFAMLFFLLMFPSALPIPTGGVTHVFQFIVVLVALETLIGRSTVWLPERFRKKSLGNLLGGKVLPLITKWLKKAEKFTKPRWSSALANRPARGLYGIIVIIFTLFAAFAPPFSGLDTLPSLGVVLVSLALFFEDSLMFLIGTIIGAIGCGINLAAITTFIHFLSRYFN